MPSATFTGIGYLTIMTDVSVASYVKARTPEGKKVISFLLYQRMAKIVFRTLLLVVACLVLLSLVTQDYNFLPEPLRGWANRLTTFHT